MAVSGALDPAVTQLTGQLRDMAARITQLERNQRSGYNAPNTSIDGGSLTINDAVGNPAIVIGAQSDGTFAVKQVGTVVPPLAPSTPLVLGGIQGVIVSWDGLMNDGTTPLSDFAATQVHVSVTPAFPPSSGTLVGQMLGVNGAGQASDPSAQASGSPAAIPAGTIPDGSITALKIQTGTITTAQIAAAAGILGSQIAGATITAANIFAGTITVALLAANIVVSGIVDATTITGSILRNSATDPKTSINSDGSITITNVSGTVIFRIEANGTIDWYSPSGTLMMKLKPGGTQLIYASLTGPTGWDFEPPGYPAVLFSASSAVSSATYANAVVLPSTVPGSTVTVVASSSGATAATGVTDTVGNTYTLIQSVTANQYMQVFQAVNATVLTSHDSITVTYAAANTQEKNIIAMATAGVLTASVTDFSASANGSGTAVSVSGTPTNYGDLVMMFVSDASAGGIPSAIPDGWSLAAQQRVATFQYTSVYYTSNISTAVVTGSVTIASAAWSAIILGLSPSPALPASTSSPAPVNTTLTPSTAWAGNGQLSLKMTHSNTLANWGATFPAFPVIAGTLVSMAAQIYTPAILTAVSIGFTFWSGPNATGSNLGSASGDQGTLTTTAGGIYQVSITGASVPAGAQSAVFFVNEGAADAANVVMHIDAIQVPGGLVYSNSPLAGTDDFGNPYDQGINFVGLPGLTNTFSVNDPFGNKLAKIDGSGNITGQTISAASDVLVGGQSLLNDLVGPSAQGLVNYGFKAIGGTAWPSTAIGTTEQALFELDQTCQPGRLYEFAMNQTIINTTGGAGSMHLHLRYTTDGSTPTTSSTEAVVVASRIENTGTDAAIGPLRALFGPFGSATTLKCLVTGHAGANSWQFKNDDNVRCMIYDLGTTPLTNNLTVLGTGGTGGGSSGQTFTEYFYGNNTWTYYSNSGLRGHNTTIYQGAYSGEAPAYQYAYIQFSTGSLGNSLNTVLNYTVNSVKFRLLNQHSWYNYGMTVGLHSSTVLGAIGYSSILDFWNISEGAQLSHALGSSAWAPFKAGGTTYAVLAPTSNNLTNLNWYGYFWGGGPNNANVPAMIVNYTH